MASNITKTRTVRLPNEVADYFADKPLREILERIYNGEYTDSERAKELNKAKEFISHLEEENDYLRTEIVTLEQELLTKDDEGFVNLPEENQILSPEETYEMDNLRAACAERNIKVTDAIRKVAQSIWNS